MLEDKGDDVVFPGEPEGGWQTAPLLSDTELISIVCCKWTGLSLKAPEHYCLARDLRGHRDEDCAAVFIRAKDSEGNDIPVGVVSEITVSTAGDDLNVQ
jgi:hypothetical protein